MPRPTRAGASTFSGHARAPYVPWDGKRRSAITVRSASGPDLTTIDGGGSSSVVNAFDTLGGSVLDGFTIRNGSSSGVSVGDGALTIMNCKI